MRILVTGATGKIGNAVARRLADRGDEVVALVRDPARARELLPEGIELAAGDVTDLDSIGRAATGADAAVNSMGIFEQWTGEDDVFDAPRGGTVSEARVADYEKSTPYERSKQLAERLVLAEAEQGIEAVLVNPAAIVGPGPWAGAGWDGFLLDLLRGRLPVLPPGGMTITWIDDAADAHVAALDRGTPGERYIVADGFATAREVAEVAVAEAGRGRVPPVMPERLARGLARGGEALSRVIRRPPLLPKGQLDFLLWEARADSTKVREELGIEPLDWREAVRRTTRWVIDSGRA
jgi:dihydroflavonol-4-reductase